MTRYSDPNLATIAVRGLAFRATFEDSQERKAALAVARPQSFGALLGWFRREWQAEYDGITQLHISGVEPDSQLGAPRLSGPMRARMNAVDRDRSSTDYDPSHDTWDVGSAPRYPMLDALHRFGQKAPILRRYLEAVAYAGFDWRRVGETWLRVYDPWAGEIVDGRPRGGFVPDDEHAYLTTYGALGALWEVWSAGQRDAGRTVA